MLLAQSRSTHIRTVGVFLVGCCIGTVIFTRSMRPACEEPILDGRAPLPAIKFTALPTVTPPRSEQKQKYLAKREHPFGARDLIGTSDIKRGYSLLGAGACRDATMREPSRLVCEHVPCTQLCVGMADSCIGFQNGTGSLCVVYFRKHVDVAHAYSRDAKGSHGCVV